MKSLIIAAASVALLAPAALSAKPAPAFLRDAMKGDNGEVRMGRLAERRAASAEVRDYGKMLERDHGAHRQQVAQLARGMGVSVPATAIKPDAARAQAHLQRLRGPAFDRAFVRHMIEDHRKDIAEYEEQARTGRQGTAELAQQTLPVLREHLRTAEQLAR